MSIVEIDPIEKLKKEIKEKEQHAFKTFVEGTREAFSEIEKNNAFKTFVEGTREAFSEIEKNRMLNNISKKVDSIIEKNNEELTDDEIKELLTRAGAMKKVKNMSISQLFDVVGKKISIDDGPFNTNENLILAEEVIKELDRKKLLTKKILIAFILSLSTIVVTGGLLTGALFASKALNDSMNSKRHQDQNKMMNNNLT